jgi:hypothetical protein
MWWRRNSDSASATYVGCLQIDEGTQHGVTTM